MKRKNVVKLLALVLAMVMTMASVNVYLVNAAESTKVSCYAMEAKSSSDTSRYRVKLTNSVAVGDVISFYVKPVMPDGSIAEAADMYARGSSTKAIYLDANGNETGVNVYSGQAIPKNAISGTNGWYYIECVVKADCSSGFELSVSGTNVAGGLLGQCYIADVKVNGKNVTPVGYNSGSALTVTSITLSTGTGSNTSATPTPKPAATTTPKPSTGSITSYAMEVKSSSDASRYRVKLTTSVAVGDVISFYVKPVMPDGSIAEAADMYARGGGTKAIYLDTNGNETGVNVYSGQAIPKNAISNTNGWYYIECVVKAACSSGFELSVSGTNVAGGLLGQCYIADVKVNGKNVTPVGYNSGATLATSTVTGLGSGETVTPTPKPVATATATPTPTVTVTPNPTATPTPTTNTNIPNPSKAYSMEPKEGTGVTESSRWRVRLYDQIVTGDIISFWVKPSVIENADMYARDGVKATYLDAQGNSLGKDVYSGAHITDYAISEFNGWYYIQCMATGDSVSFELSVDATNTAAGVMGQCYIADIRINGVEAKEIVNYSDGSSIGYSTIDSKGQISGSSTGSSNTNQSGDPYTWKVNATLGGAQNLPAVNLAATGKSSSVTNVNSKLIAALETTTFVNMNNMIFIISDGMGQNDVLVAEKYTHNLIMNDMPVYGQHQTVSYAKPGEGNGWITTDSAAAGTALSSGYKTRYTYMGLDVNGKDVKQITEVLREKLGKIIGVVTTGWAYDATPATYGGAHAVRGNNSEVSKEIRSFAPDLFIGAGLNDYSGNLPSGQSIGIYENWSTGIKSTKDKVWISIEKDSTSTDDNVRYTDGSSSARPTISQMMAYSLTWLQAKSDKNNNVGFFLMFENGMTDDAGHNNDLDQKIGELHATDEAVAIALKFACENPDTVVIVTSDHDTGRLTLGSGWEKDITKAKFGTTGHSKQDVAIYAIGKNTSVFDNQIMYNCQVAKVTAYLFGIKDFGTSESTYDIDDIIAGVKNEVEDATAEEDKVVGKVLSIKASSSTSKMTLTMSNLSINVHDMVSVAIQVPKGATSVKITTNTGEVVASQSLDKTLNYVEDYTYYYLTFKPSENANKLIFEFRGSFSKSDEIWIDDLTIASSCIRFDDYSISNASGSSETTVQITTAK